MFDNERIRKPCLTEGLKAKLFLISSRVGIVLITYLKCDDKAGKHFSCFNFLVPKLNISRTADKAAKKSDKNLSSQIFLRSFRVSNFRSKLRGTRTTRRRESKMESEFAFITHSVLCRAIKINRFCFSLFYFRIPFQIIIILVPLNEYHVYDKNKYSKRRRKPISDWGKSHCTYYGII